MLVLAIDSYEKVKENETVEALHERAKMIVNMELLCENYFTHAAPTTVFVQIPRHHETEHTCWSDPNGCPFLGPHKYKSYLHILTKADPSGSEYVQPWEGITGRVKFLVKKETKESEVRVIEANAQAIQAVEKKLEGIEQMLAKLLEQKE